MRLMYNGVGSGHYVAFDVSDSVSVTDSGGVSLAENTSVADLEPTNTAQFDSMRGKFFVNRGRYQCSTEIADGVIYFIPSDATVNVSSDDSGNIITCNKVQPVTGYAAIPAGTTIEYLGKLGDKARVQTLSYIGTGTFGKNNACSLTFDFAPKRIFWLGITDSSFVSHVNPAKLSTDYSRTNAIGSANSGQRYTKISEDKKTIMWYQTAAPSYQLNDKNVEYAVVAIG